MDIEHHLIMDSEGAKPIIRRAVARACVQAELHAPGLLVEIMVTAAR